MAGLSGENMRVLSAIVAFNNQATEIKLSKKISNLSRIQVAIASSSDMTGLIVTKEFYPNFFTKISSVQVIDRYSPTACIKTSQTGDDTLAIWSCAQMVELGFPETMYCVISGF